MQGHRQLQLAVAIVAVPAHDDVLAQLQQDRGGIFLAARQPRQLVQQALDLTGRQLQPRRLGIALRQYLFVGRESTALVDRHGDEPTADANRHMRSRAANGDCFLFAQLGHLPHVQARPDRKGQRA
jgi:hypothetical protein